MKPDIHIQAASLSYQQHIVFKDISLDIPFGRHLVILGASGIGKTSLLRMLAGLTAQNEMISGKISTSNAIALSLQTTYLAQQDRLLPWLTTLDNAALVLKLRHHSRAETVRKRELAHHLLERAGLGRAKALFPHQLSSGMRQRAALVRTLLEEKPVILMDEPFSALDTLTRFQLQNLAHDMLREKTVIMITHDPQEALRLGDEIYLMQGAPANLTFIAVPDKQPPRDLRAPECSQWTADIFAVLLNQAQPA